jgi:hypothetical protein
MTSNTFAHRVKLLIAGAIMVCISVLTVSEAGILTLQAGITYFVSLLTLALIYFLWSSPDP